MKIDSMAKQKEKPRKAANTWQQAYGDLEWASNSDELQQKFLGEFVVVHDKTVVGHACDRREALRQAMHAGYRRRELVVVPILAQEFETPPDDI
jgi:hypothetical protein